MFGAVYRLKRLLPVRNTVLRPSAWSKFLIWGHWVPPKRRGTLNILVEPRQKSYILETRPAVKAVTSRAFRLRSGCYEHLFALLVL